MSRPLYEIAEEIDNDWVAVNKNPNGFIGKHPAHPYLEAMRELDRITDRYGCDDAEGIVQRFLGNATTWKGETARKIKQELRDLIKAR